ncbi:MAG: hypothetical protein VST69_01705, partial [Nitrospirota bacterium]|nr:hypothetical protein [Nitrospirota bacterium]
QKRGNASFVFEPVDPRDFDANLIVALEEAPDYGGLTEVTTIDRLYSQREREDVKTFIREQLYFEDQDNFLAMMRLKLKIDKEWDAINQILQEAGRVKRNNSAYLLQPDNGSDFSSNLNEAIGPLTSPLVGRFQDVESYYEALEALERDFYMSTESFSYLMQVGLKEAPSTWDWSKVDEVLLAAYQNKVVSKRQVVLQVLRETEGLTALLHFALGEMSETAESNPLGRLSVAVTNDEDTAFLEEISLREEDPGDVSELEWQKLYGIVERAQRFFDNFVLSPPLKERWINLFPAADAPKVLSQSSVSSQSVASDSPRWLTFGGANSDADEQTVPEPILGWAMSSPLFALSEGLRVLTLTFAFDPETFFLETLQALFPETESTTTSPLSGEGPLQVDISGEKGWITPDSLAIQWGLYAELTQTEASDLQGMQLTLSFSAALDAIAVFSEADVPSPWPLLRIKLRQSWDDILNRFVTQYAPLRDLQLLKAHVAVTVSGLNTLELENDQNTLNAKKPFEPFARRPSVGSQFYIGHSELFQKRLDTVGFEIEWMGVPPKLEDHYKNYGLEEGFVFEVEMSLLDRRIKHSLDKGVSLFANMSAADTVHTVQIPSQAEIDEGVKLADLLFSANGFQYERDLSDAFEGNPSSWRRFLRWELKSPDFQHDVYASISSTKSLALSAAIANRSSGDSTSTIDPTDYQVNGPYTPKIKQLSLSYSASLEVVLEEASSKDQDQFFHL